jgi:phosphatidylinositol glycan class N
VGTVPLFYIAGNEEIRTKNLFANAQQIYEQFIVKEEDKRSKTKYFFRPFHRSEDRNLLVRKIENLIEQQQYKEAQEHCQNLVSFSIEGLSYYQTYDWPVLMTIVTIGYVSWIFFLLTHTLINFTEFSQNIILQKPVSKNYNTYINLVTLLVCSMVNMFLVAQTSSWLYHVYAVFPIIFVNYLIKKLPYLIYFIRNITTDWTEVVFNGITYIVVLEIMVIGYFKRGVFSSCFIILGIAPTLIGISIHPRFGWLVACIFMSLFTLLPVDYGSDTTLVCFGGLVIMVIQVLWRRYYVHHPHRTRQGRFLFGFQLSLICLSSLIVYHTESSLHERKGLPLPNQIASWGITAVSLIAPLFSPRYYKMRIQSLVMALACPFILLSVNYEVLFLAGLDVVLVLWIIHDLHARGSDPKEPANVPPKPRFIESIDFATALLFIFFINMGFFGTGNLATIASFELKSVYRFVTVFSPFLMTGILFVKIMTPLLITTSAFGVILHATGTSQYGVFFIVLALFDVMTLNFFFLVQDFGSWLEIGNSISRYGISNVMIVFLLLLFALSQIYTKSVQTSVLTGQKEHKHKSKTQ